MFNSLTVGSDAEPANEEINIKPKTYLQPQHQNLTNIRKNNNYETTHNPHTNVY
jgi:hypothetical protein